jgi:L-amino acid N-acyltransferase
LEQIVEIYNQAILTMQVTGDLKPFKTEQKREWFLEHENDKYPLLAAEYNNKIIGWISISPYRKGREALIKTVEVSYYIDCNFRKKGIGTKLLVEMIKRSNEIGYKTMFAILFDNNIGSIKLLEKNNFEKWGFLPDVVEINGKTYGHLYYGRKI